MMGSRYPRLSRVPPMRRDRGGRVGVDSFIDGGFYLEDLNIDPFFQRKMGSRLPDGFDFDPRTFDRRRGSDGRRIFDERPFPLRSDIIHDDNGMEHGLAMAQSRSNPLPFGRAMKNLHNQLGKAEELYSRFQSEYENEIAAVKKYTKARTLSSMWASKVKGERDPQTFAEDEDRLADDDIEKFDQNFADMEKKVAAALRTAVSSTLNMVQSSEKQQARFQASKRLQQRLRLALQQFMDLMEKAKESGEHCRYLVDELQKFQALVNPDSEMNKELYRSSDEDEDASADAQPAGGAVWDD
jgi:hypothetical protein